MIVSSLFIASVIVLEAGPVYILFLAGLRGDPVSPLQWIFIVGSFLAAGVVMVLAVVKPMKSGLKALERHET